MIRLLKRFADWLDSRFPAKVVLTEANVKALLLDLDEHGELLTSHEQTLHGLRAEVEGLKASVLSLRDSIAKSAPPPSIPTPSKEALRAAFIAGEFRSGPPRAELEKAANG